MTSIRRWSSAIAAVAIAAVTIAACQNGDSGNRSKPQGDIVRGGTFTMAFSADPGALDPQLSVATNTFQLTQFAYDPLLQVDADGHLQSGLAESWKEAGTRITLTLKKGVSCASGQPFTAQDAAANVNFVGDPKNKSPFTGTYLPAGSKATATGSTVVVTTPQPAPFVLNGLANVPMVCAKGMADRRYLRAHTDGTGPYSLASAKPNDSYTYKVHDGYAWGPNGAMTSAEGIPSTVMVRIVPNETTAANLLLSGDLNAATIVGADGKRLDARKLFHADASAVIGEMWFNHTKDHAGSDPAVRKALVQALDLGDLAKVFTSGRGTSGTAFAVVPPAACPGKSVPDALPPQDLAAAKLALDTAGWKAGPDGIRSKAGRRLALTLLTNTQNGAGASAAAELAVKAWQQLGAQVRTVTKDETASLQVLFSTGEWDIAWQALNLNSPDQAVPFLSGPTGREGGNNFAAIDNSAYQAGVKKASAKQGSASCGDWLAAEAEIVKAADVVPFANQLLKFYGVKASFAIAGALVPTSIRMRAN